MKTLTAEERRELIYRPFPITYYGRSYPWSGTILGDRYPQGRAGKALLYEDDELCGPRTREDYLNFIDANGRRLITQSRGRHGRNGD